MFIMRFVPRVEIKRLKGPTKVQKLVRCSLRLWWPWQMSKSKLMWIWWCSHPADETAWQSCLHTPPESCEPSSLHIYCAANIQPTPTLDISLSLYIYIYMYMCMYIYIFFFWEREWERKREICISLINDLFVCLSIYLFIFIPIYLYIFHHMHQKRHATTPPNILEYTK